MYKEKSKETRKIVPTNGAKLIMLENTWPKSRTVDLRSNDGGNRDILINREIRIEVGSKQYISGSPLSKD